MRICSGCWKTLGVAVASVAVLVAVFGTSPAPFQTGGAPALAASRSVEVTITAAQNNVEFGFNGYKKGGMTITVPVGAQVVVHFENAGALPHSLVVETAGAGQVLAPPTTPAFAGAATNNPAGGFPKGGKQTITFDASKPGTYEVVCAVPTHAMAGQWFTLIVSPSAEAASVTPADAAVLVQK